jgi:peptidoglycan/xylan/chitin deacetylase (PgdA/CDA1 family)
MDPAALAEAFSRGSPIRAVNFHATPARRAAEYDRQLAELAERFAPCTEDDLEGFLRTGRWPRKRPGVIVALYNGYRDNHDVMRPLLDRHGLTGWFFVVTGWTGCEPSGQVAFACDHGIGLVEGEYPDGRHALSWDEVRALDGAGHVIASHTRSTVRVSEPTLRASRTSSAAPRPISSASSAARSARSPGSWAAPTARTPSPTPRCTAPATSSCSPTSASSACLASGRRPERRHDKNLPRPRHPRTLPGRQRQRVPRREVPPLHLRRPVR